MNKNYTAPNAVEKIQCGPVPYAPTQDITYTPFNKCSTITEGNYDLAYTYGPDQQRRKSILTENGNTLKEIIYAGNYEKITVNGQIYEVHYIAGGDGLTAINVRINNGSDELYYVYTDHLGAILKLTDATGNTVYETNFDPWGRERNPNTWDYTPNTPPEWLISGFTGHEHLPEFGLINMNGRMYDPVIGRVLSPDNYVQDPSSTQDYNRYTYALNNPMFFTDHTGQKRKPPQGAWDPPWREKNNSSSNFSYDMAFTGGEYIAMSSGDLSWIFGKAFPDVHELFTLASGTMLENAATQFFESRPQPSSPVASQGGGGSDYRANLITAKDPIRDIFSAIRTAKSENTLTNLYDVIVPNAYGTNYIYQNYSKTLTYGEHTFKINIHGYSSNLPESYYDIYEMGFGYLDRFSKYTRDPRYNSGYAVGFYMTGYNQQYFITIGAKTIEGYQFLLNLYKQ